jgi:hypothetical protein
MKQSPNAKICRLVIKDEAIYNSTGQKKRVNDIKMFELSKINQI